jgi:hypothetical protein
MELVELTRDVCGAAISRGDKNRISSSLLGVGTLLWTQ